MANIESGFNRTGAQTSPLALHIMQSYAELQTQPVVDAPPDGNAIASVRSAYVLDADVSGVGSVPMPGTLAGSFVTAMSYLSGMRPEVLVDKLGERLAFERSSVRLYQALIDKTEALATTGVALPFSAAELRRIRDEELEHMHIAASALDSLGADSSAQTPSADVAAVASSGVMQVLTDPRTSISQCLEALLGVELLDDANWALLILLAVEAGQDELLPQFKRAHLREGEHVLRVRTWLENLLLGELG